jgi:Uma2 family endonuclease
MTLLQENPTAYIMTRPDAVLQFQALQKALIDEKERRIAFQQWLDEDKKAEFINGEIVLHSPVKVRHLRASSLLTMLLSVFCSKRQLGVVYVEKALVSLTRNDYEPDICFWRTEIAATFTDDQMLLPAPDFVVEILSRKTAKNDKGIKRIDYAAHGIKEYWIIDPNKQTVEQNWLRQPTDTTYYLPELWRIDDDITSIVLPDFTIPIRAIFDEKTHQTCLSNL